MKDWASFLPLSKLNRLVERLNLMHLGCLASSAVNVFSLFAHHRTALNLHLYLAKLHLGLVSNAGP